MQTARNFFELNAPSLLKGWDWAVEAQEATNAWGWVKEGMAVFFLLLFTYRTARWAWLKFRKDSVGAFVIRELSGDGVAWLPDHNCLETLKVHCKLNTLPGDTVVLSDVQVCGQSVLCLVTDGQRAKITKLAEAAIKRCKKAEQDTAEKFVLDLTRRKVYTASEA